MSSRKRDSLALAGGSLVTGLLSYVVFALTTRGLTPAVAAPVSVLWSYWAVAAAALTFPLQHWIARSVPAHGEASVRRAAPRLGATVALLAGATALVTWLAREPLFGRGDPWFPVMVGLVTVGSALIGVIRGVLTARHRFVAVATSMVMENAVRCLAAGVLFVLEVRSAVAYGLVLVVGHLVAFLWPSALRLGPAGRGALVSPFAFLAGAGFGQLAAQVVLTSGTVLLALTGGSATHVTALFAALALFRAPYMIALGVMPQLTSRLTARSLTGDVRALRQVATVSLAALAVTVPVAAIMGAWVGPALLEIVFGEGVRLDPSAAALVAAGSTVAVFNLVLMVSAMAQNRAVAAARAWASALAGGALAFVVLAGLDPLLRVVSTFVAAEAVAFIALLVANRHGLRTDGPASAR